jgi:hypothetical protein
MTTTNQACCLNRLILRCLKVPAENLTFRASYLGLLEAFEAVLRMQQEASEPHVWYYFANLDGPSYKTPSPKTMLESVTKPSCE